MGPWILFNICSGNELSSCGLSRLSKTMLNYYMDHHIKFQPAWSFHVSWLNVKKVCIRDPCELCVGLQYGHLFPWCQLCLGNLPWPNKCTTLFCIIHTIHLTVMPFRFKVWCPVIDCLLHICGLQTVLVTLFCNNWALFVWIGWEFKYHVPECMLNFIYIYIFTSRKIYPFCLVILFSYYWCLMH